MFWGVHFQKVRRFWAIDETRSQFAILCGLRNKPQRSGGVKKKFHLQTFFLFSYRDIMLIHAALFLKNVPEFPVAFTLEKK